MPHKKSFADLEKKLGLNFKDKKLLRQAFVHRSYINEHPREGKEHNERLEYLGDAVMELIVSHHLFSSFPDKDEGELTALRAALVNTQTISQVGDNLGLNDYLYLSRGEEKSRGRARRYILANTFEALLGAIYLDQGMETARSFLVKFLFPHLNEIIEKHLWLDAKSYFQEKAQEKEGETPTYRVLSEEGPDHAKTFTVGVYIGEKEIARGRGPSKQEAEQAAAAKGLQKRGWTPNNT